MIECVCSCDGDSGGIFDRYEASTREYQTCCECGDTIWPWQTHEVGLWWDCESCDQWLDCEACERCDLEPTSESHMCAACAAACKSLLCDCWFVGMVWDSIADRNDMSMAECLGGNDDD